MSGGQEIEWRRRCMAGIYNVLVLIDDILLGLTEQLDGLPQFRTG